MPALTPIELAILDKLRNGIADAGVAMLLAVPVKQVQSVRELAEATEGLLRRDGKLSVDRRKARRKDFAAVVAAGNSMDDAAAAFGISRINAYSACREFGVKPVKPARRTRVVSRITDATLTILAAIIRGGSNAEIAESNRVAEALVRSIKHRAKNAGIFEAVNAARKRTK